MTTSSEALLAGKAPTFRLLVWAVDALGEPVSNVTYVVSENFVVSICFGMAGLWYGVGHRRGTLHLDNSCNLELTCSHSV